MKISLTALLLTAVENLIQLASPFFVNIVLPFVRKHLKYE
jgi:hypothetical protein